MCTWYDSRGVCKLPRSVPDWDGLEPAKERRANLPKQLQRAMGIRGVDVGIWPARQVRGVALVLFTRCREGVDGTAERAAPGTWQPCAARSCQKLPQAYTTQRRRRAPPAAICR